MLNKSSEMCDENYENHLIKVILNYFPTHHFYITKDKSIYLYQNVSVPKCISHLN